jgi:hypothetical protein
MLTRFVIDRSKRFAPAEQHVYLQRTLAFDSWRSRLVSRHLHLVASVADAGPGAPAVPTSVRDMQTVNAVVRGDTFSLLV